MNDDRRRLLALLGSAGVTTLAGCSINVTGPDDTETEAGTSTKGTDDTETATETVTPTPTETDPETITETPAPTNPKLAPEDGDSGDLFGSAVGVSSDGTRAVITSSGDNDPNGELAGSAYVFNREGEAWSEKTKLVPEDGDSGDRFGRSVGVSSDGMTAVISAANDEDPNGTADGPLGGAGSAYVFKQEGARAYSPAVIGATGAGSAYVFKQEGGEWNEETKLAPEDGDNKDRFGGPVGVSSDGTTAVIGAPNDEDPNGTAGGGSGGEGSAYVFKQEGGE